MNMDEILSSYELQIQQLQKENEISQSCIDDYKKKIENFHLQEKSHMEEKEQIKNDISKLTATYNLQKSEFETEKSRLIECREEKRNAVLEEISNLEKQNNEIKSEIESYNNIVSIEDTELPESLKNDISELEAIKESVNFELVFTEKQIYQLDSDIQGLRGVKEDLLLNLEMKRKQIMEMQQTIEDLQEDNNSMKMKIEHTSNYAINGNSQSNSLFAEVNDKRVQLKNQIDALSAKYNKAAKLIESLQNEVEFLGASNVELKHLLEADALKFCVGNSKEMSAYGCTLSGLKTLLAHYEQEITKSKREEPRNTSREQDLDYYEENFVYNRVIMKSLQENIDMQTFDHQMTDRQILLLGTEMRKWNREKLNLEKENVNLNVAWKQIQDNL